VPCQGAVSFLRRCRHYCPAYSVRADAGTLALPPEAFDGVRPGVSAPIRASMAVFPTAISLVARADSGTRDRAHCHTDGEAHQQPACPSQTRTSPHGPKCRQSPPGFPPLRTLVFTHSLRRRASFIDFVRRGTDDAFSALNQRSSLLQRHPHVSFQLVLAATQETHHLS